MVNVEFVYWVLLVILLFKLVSNLLIPVALWHKKVIDPITGETGGVSFSPVIEIFLTLLALLVVYFMGGEDDFYSIEVTLYVFVGGTLLSYMVALIGVMLIGWLRSNKID